MAALLQNLMSVAYHMSSMLFDPDAGEDTVRRAALNAWTHLPVRESMIQTSVFLLEQDGLYRSVVDVQEGQIHLDTNFLSEQQLPEGWKNHPIPVRMQRGSRHELWIPLTGDRLLGFMVWVSTREFYELSMETLITFQQTVSLGFRHYLTMRQTRGQLRLLQATTDLSHLIASTDSTEQILMNLVESSVRVLGFDRATLFMFDTDEETVSRAIYFGIGSVAPEQLDSPPQPPILSNEPTSMPHIQAIWAPLLLDGRRTAGLLLDNLYSHDPAPNGALQAVMDLAAQVVLALQKANLVELLNAKASRDDLTGLFRVEHFYTTATQILDENASCGQRCGLLMLDIDDFKQVNDTYGHPVGDAVLIHTASVIHDCLPDRAIAGRIGGDEFVILVPGTTLADCRRVGRQLLDKFRSTNFAFVPPSHQGLTISIGISTSPLDGQSVGDLIHAADKAMYVSKRNGKSQVSLSTDVFTA